MINFFKENPLNDNVVDNDNRETELIDLVFSLYNYRMKKGNLRKHKLYKSIKVMGKNIEHKIDIYFEFIQMNNLERTVIKTIDGKVVKAEDVWQFNNLLTDLGYFPKGVLYYNYKIEDEALSIAKDKNIQVIYFDVMRETIKNVIQSISKVLPDENVIGDPFWILMQIDDRTKNNTGSYFVIENFLPLFTSKKLADVLCKQQKGYAVFGVSQQHLSFLLNCVEDEICPYKICIILPSKQVSSSINYNVEMYCVNCQTFRKLYVR